MTQFQTPPPTEQEVKALIANDPRYQNYINKDSPDYNLKLAEAFAKKAFVGAAKERQAWEDRTAVDRFSDAFAHRVSQARESTLTAPRHVQEFKRQATEEPARTFVRPIAEAVGMTGGLTLSGGNPLGGVGGIAMGSALADEVEFLTGEQTRPKTVDQSVARGLHNLETGFIAGTLDKGMEAGALVTKAVWNKLKAPAKAYLSRHPELLRIRGLAESMGVELTAGEVTNLSLLKSFVEGVAERAPFSKWIMEHKQMKQLKALINERNRLLEKGGAPESISETGQLIQQRTQQLMDEIGVTQETTRRELTDSVLSRLGSRESFEALGLDGQDAFRAYRTGESDRIADLFTATTDHVVPGSRVLPTNLNNTVEAMEQRSRNTNTKLLGVEKDWMDNFRGSGNIDYDRARPIVEEAAQLYPEGSFQWQLRRQRFIEDNARVGDGPPPQPGWTYEELIDNRNRLNTAIDQVDEGLKLTGRVGERGVGASKTNITKGRLIKLKKALDADIEAYARTQSPELQGALQVARAASGDLKALTNLKGVKRFMRAQPQQAAQMLAQSKDLTAIRQMRTIMGPDFRNVDRAFSNSLLGVGKEGTLTGASIRRELNKYDPGVVEAMVGNGEAAQIRRLADQLDANEATAITNPLFQRILKSEHPERVVDLIVKPHNVVNIQEVRRMLGQGAVNDLKRGLVNKILQKPAIDVPDEEFMLAPEKILTSLRNYGDNTLNELFKDDPGFIKEMFNIAEVANAAKGASRLSLRRKAFDPGPPLIAFGEISLTIFDPIMGGKVLLAIPAMAALYTSKKGRQWLTDGLRVRAGTPEGREIASNIRKMIGLGTASARMAPPVVPVEQRPAFQPQQLSATQMALADTHPFGTPAGANPSRQGVF